MKKYLAKMSPAGQTSIYEGWHVLLLWWASKHPHYSYHGMRIRFDIRDWFAVAVTSV